MEKTIIRFHKFHIPTLGQTLVSLGCINRRGGVEFKLSKNGIPTLEEKKMGTPEITQNGFILLSGHVVM